VRALGIFAAAPIPGRVKPRLTEDVGPSTAAEIYWRVGRQVVESAAGSGYRTTVWFTPPDEGAFMREWLEGLGRIELRPQAGGDLDSRLRHAFTRHFAEGADRAVIIRTDCPGTNRRLVTEAFTALGAYDVVLGPTVRGGAYLVGLRQPHDALLHGIPWSRGPVLGQLRARAAAQRLRLRLLKPLRAVDTLEDARVLGLLNS
jgi:rSAM/selenodomain-associated transferase 1